MPSTKSSSPRWFPLFGRCSLNKKNFSNKVINFFGKNPPTVNEDVAKIVEWETKIGEITEHEYSSRDRYELELWNRKV